MPEVKRKPVAWLQAIAPDSLLTKMRAYRKQLRNFRILSTAYGQFWTIRHGSCLDPDGNALPWYTYPAIEFLEGLHLSDAAVFEYGSGSSSQWWSDRVKEIVSVEHDKGWYDIVSGKLRRDNFTYVLSTPEAYADQLAAFERRFDVIIVDGIRRVDCGARAIEHMGRFGGTMLILDNSDRYPNLVYRIQGELGWVRADMHGFGPINDYTWTTSIWIDQRQVADLYLRSRISSRAGLGQHAEDDALLGG